MNFDLNNYDNEETVPVNPTPEPSPIVPDMPDFSHIWSAPEIPDAPSMTTEPEPAPESAPAPKVESQPQYYREADFREVDANTKRPYSPSFTGSAQYYTSPSRELRERDPAYSPIPVERGRGGNGRGGGGFLRMLILVLVCSLVSTAVSWSAIRYGVESGNFNFGAKGQTVVLGATTSPTAQSENPTALPQTFTVGELTGAEIYSIAANQVVTISTAIPERGWQAADTVYGSGFVISEDGYILTNNHVIEYASLYGYELTVSMRDGTSYSAKVIGTEPDNDVAVIKIDASGLPAVNIGSSAGMQVGETIYAVGNPRLLDYTMTDGIISALDRTVTVDTSSNVSINMFQISAAVNNGNSGGPVYNTRGEVIGIVSAKYMSSSTEGLGFAIPIDDAMDIATELVEIGYVTGKPKLGISVYTVDARTAEYYNMVEGVFVKIVEPGSCAEKAGIVPGDIITKLGDFEVLSSEALRDAKRSFRAGDTTSVKIFRSGEELTLKITFDEEQVTTN